MEIPLFPLPNLVLFPQVAVPLHIFEERYKLMINGCIDNEEVFGLVLLRSGESEESEAAIHKVGVTARVVQVERFPDGRMNILSAGEARFRILQFTGNSPYWTASVDFFEDDEESIDEMERVQEEVRRLYRRATDLTASLRSVDVGESVLPESPVALSYMVSYVLDIDPSEKQQLLESTSTVQRLKALIQYLQQTLKQLELQAARREIASKVRGNGKLGKPESVE